MSNKPRPGLTVLRDYAAKREPQTLSPTVLYDFTDTTIAIFDAYPKSIFHFLIMPRLRPALTIFDLSDLRSLLNSKSMNKEAVRKVLEDLGAHAKKVRGDVEEEMIARYGFKWKISIGFHAVPSMQHLHLHVISADFCSPSMKNKKHYNSFHPGLGFFLHFDDVMSWRDAAPSFYKEKSALKISQYEPLLKRNLECHWCGKGLKNVPTLKAHLQDEFDERLRQAKPPSDSLSGSSDKRRKREGDSGELEGEPANKKASLGPS